MKRLATTLLLGLAVAALPAFASEPAAAPAPTEEKVANAESDAKPSRIDNGCVRSTGTRIKSRAARDSRGCNGAFGTSYTREELERTGASSNIEALRMLSPRVGR